VSLSTALCLAVAVAVVPAHDAARAEAVVAEALAFHSDGELAEASAALERAYRIYPDRDYLYMRGLIEREAGNCDIAVDLFAAFLDESPPLVDVEATQEQLAKCEATLPSPAPEPATEPPPPTATPVRVEPPTSVDRSVPTPERWWRDPAGGGLFGSGLVLVAAGAGMLAGAAVSADVERADTAGKYRQGVQRAQGLNAAGIAVVSLGAGLAIGGIIRWVVVARRSPR
jgi:tetratricopeptide (TPR) repeat protein